MRPMCAIMTHARDSTLKGPRPAIPFGMRQQFLGCKQSGSGHEEFLQLNVEWKQPKRTFKAKRPDKGIESRARNTPLSVFLQIKEVDDEPNTDEDDYNDTVSICSSLSGSAEFWLLESDSKRGTFIDKWINKYLDRKEAVYDGETDCDQKIHNGHLLNKQSSAKNVDCACEVN